MVCEHVGKNLLSVSILFGSQIPQSSSRVGMVGKREWPTLCEGNIAAMSAEI